MIDSYELDYANDVELGELAYDLARGTDISTPVPYYVDQENNEAYFLDDDEVYIQIKKLTKGRFSNLLFKEYKNDYNEVIKNTLIFNHFQEEIL
jgi:hypothetical protein